MTKEIMLVFEFRKLFKYAINGGGKIITPGPKGGGSDGVQI